MAKKISGRERHHRHPISQKASYSRKFIHEERNISFVRPDYHRAYHLIFGNLLPSEVAQLLTEVYISPDWYMVAMPRRKRQPKNRRKRLFCTACDAVILQHLKRGGKPCGACHTSLTGGPEAK